MRTAARARSAAMPAAIAALLGACAPAPKDLEPHATVGWDPAATDAARKNVLAQRGDLLR